MYGCISVQSVCLSVCVFKSYHEVIFWKSFSSMTHVVSSDMKIAQRQALRGCSCCMSELLTSADSSPIIVGAAED